jgi:SAM-dependent methyltransferase
VTLSSLARSIHYRAKRLRRLRPTGPQAHWARIVMNQSISETLERLGPSLLDSVEVSGTFHENRGWKSYESLSYPEFDLCKPPETRRQFDVVLCEQVLEHVVDPWTAAKTLHSLAKPGGHVVVSTPFLLRIHNAPGDYWRFTPEGLAIVLQTAGLDVVNIQSWGNAACVKGNLRRWLGHRPWRSLKNDPYLPVVVWADAVRPLPA